MKNRSQLEKDIHYNKVKNTRARHKLEDLNYQNNINLKSINTRYAKYGKFESDESTNLRKQTNQLRYGVDNPFQSEEIKQKIKQKHIDKLGVEFPMQSQKCLDKRVKTYMNLLGVDNPSKNIKCKQKAKQTCIDRYNNENYRNIDQQKRTYANKSDSEKQKIIIKRQNTCLNKYGVKNYLEIVPKPATISKLSLRVKQILIDNHIEFEMEYRIYKDINKSKYSLYDFKFKNIILELNGDYFHANPLKYNSTDYIRIHHKDILVQDIWDNDKIKKQLAEQNGYIVKYLWEYDINKMFNNEILNWIILNCLN